MAILSPCHVLVFPAPAQGHINSMLKLAELLCAVGFHVTFLTPTYIHRRLSQHSDFISRFSQRSFRLRPIPDRPQDDLRPGSFDVKEWLDSLRATAQPFLRDLLAEDDSAPIDCVISDGILSFVLELAEETDVPVFYMRTLSACAFWAYFSLPDLIKSHQLPFDSDDLDLPVVNVGGMEGILRRRDLPSCCRSGLNSRPMQAIMHETLQTPRAKGLILNTFDHLEAATLDQIRTRIPNIYAVGPLHAHLKNRLHYVDRSSASTSLWEEDMGCLKWLDEQPSKSVIYVSFGSIVQVTKEAQMEFWHGLVNSGKRFLWVIRPDSSGILTEISEGVKQRGRVVGWAPQEEVLVHPAVGGFLTHCGWNSTLESIVAGVPMICWPHFGDQHVNSRFVGDIWKLGRDMKDGWDRVTVEKMVRDVMEARRDEFLQRAEDMAKSARESVEEGGTSYADLDRLIEDIQSLCTAK
ncbi:hypothetical protein C2S51_033776 [Perilla frutescens var. frutescens]|nr:hypothetical protein C2S51_033776 [Perilla frutescens var. frutescens]